MDVLSLLRLVARHWRATVPAMVATLVGLAAVFNAMSPTYEATASIVLLSPPEPPEPAVGAGTGPGPPPPAVDGANPFVRYGDIAVVGDIVARAMDGEARRHTLEAQGVAGYEVVANGLERGPVLEVTGEGASPAAAIRATGTVVDAVAAVLGELQETEGADPAYLITTAPLEPPSQATARYGSTVRAAIAVLAAGALATVGLATLAEAMAIRRPARPPAPRTAPAGAVRSGPSTGAPAPRAAAGSRR